MITLKKIPYPSLRAKDRLLMNILLISAFLLGGCNTKDPVATPVDNVGYSIINGDTVKTVIFKDYKKLNDKDPNGKNYIVVGDTIVTYREPKLHTPPAIAPDLSKLKNNDDPDLKGKPLRMIAIGGSLTAGVRDGGYFNEGILTSYPNLIARQMKLQKFEQPLFDAADYNGFGRKVRTGFNPTGGPVPKFNDVKNNSGVESVTDAGIKLKKSKGDFDNFAFRNIASLNGGTSYYAENGQTNADKLDAEYYRRIVPKESKLNLSGFLNSKKYDIISIDFGGLTTINNYQLSVSTPQTNQDKYIFAEAPPEAGSYDDYYVAKEVRFMYYLDKIYKVKKGILFNYPHFTKAPYFNFITDEKIQKVIGTQQEIWVGGYGKYSDNKDKYILLPTSEVDSMLSPKVHIALKKGVNSDRPLSSFSTMPRPSLKTTPSGYVEYNNMINSLGKKYNFAVVDLYSLYEKIYTGTYTTDDGIKVDPSWPNGNFFSTDGIFPSAFGQSIIANEAIKALNKQYGMDIPLISTSEYVNIK